MPQALPPRANLEWLKKHCKDRLAALRAERPDVRLADVQRDVAREYGFASWRKLKAHVESLTHPAATPVAEQIAVDDPDLVRLLAAAQDGEVEIVRAILDARPALANARNAAGRTPLHAGVESNSAVIAELLLDRGADPHARYGRSGHTALSWAATWSSPAYAQVLIARGVSPDLFVAAGMGLLADVLACFDERGLLRDGATRSGSSRYGSDGALLPCPPLTAVEQISDALYIACRNAHAAVVKFLLGKGPDLRFKAFMGGTPLHWAYFGGLKDIIHMLLHAGADPAARDDVMQATPRIFGVCAAANWGIPNMLRQRLAEDRDLAKLMDGRTSPLHQAARGGNVETIVILLTAGADPRAADGEGRTAMDVAAASGHDAARDVLQRVTDALRQREQAK